MSLKIAFHPFGFKQQWWGGMNYVKNLIHSVRFTFGSKIQCYVVCPASSPEAPKEFSSIANGVIEISDFPNHFITCLARNFEKVILARYRKEEMILKKNDIDILYGTVLPYQHRDIPSLSWIWDFQHRHLPHMFSFHERLLKDLIFTRTAQISSRIVVNSETAGQDFKRFLPRHAHKLRVARFNTIIPGSCYRIAPESILRPYHLPEKFIYLPNQFWKHKNHERVFEAVKNLKEKGREVTVVCTGSNTDYRHPRYFKDLFKKVSDWGLQQQVIYLKMVPHEHVIQLIRQSICLLNPSLFEGFGMTVNEAASVGKRVLLSDIPAHREQNVPQAVFFEPTQRGDLEEKIDHIWQKTLPGPDWELEKLACQNMPQRIVETAKSFISIVGEVLNCSF
ncbi:MAG: hypothetical protein A3G87_06900 [Omnitrophica bacterium RIFCSPLOWO2_12_FULL_50_11]|nr:MAG: hypothetical protein A3G87_06900 [Omnitrophica bacterium RIFCSPLOWO2_12_FULL_50_11]